MIVNYNEVLNNQTLLKALIHAKSANGKHGDKSAGSKPSFLDFMDASQWVQLELLSFIVNTGIRKIMLFISVPSLYLSTNGSLHL